MAIKKNKLQDAYFSTKNETELGSVAPTKPATTTPTKMPSSTVNTVDQNTIQGVDNATQESTFQGHKTDLMGAYTQQGTATTTPTLNTTAINKPIISRTPNINRGNGTTQSGASSTPVDTSSSTPVDTSSSTPTKSNTTPLQISDLDEYKNIVNQKTSALSSLNQANQLAMKYADNTAQAQGFSTQGAALQNTANLQSAYLNQAGNINQQFQKDLSSLTNTKSKDTLSNIYQTIQNEVANGTLTEEGGKALLAQYSGLLNAEDSALANTYLSQGIKGQTATAEATKKQEYDSLQTNILNNHGEISPENAQVLKDFESGNISYNEAIKKIYSSENSGETAEPETNTTTGNTIYTSSNGAKYETNIGSGWHSNFTYTVGTQEYKVELGNKINDSSFDPNSIKVGEITTYKKDGTTYLVTKDSSGIVRYVKNRTGVAVGIDNDSGNGNKVSAKGTAVYELALALGLNPHATYDTKKSQTYKDNLIRGE